MRYTEKARAALEASEKQLREIASEALAVGQYRDVALITDLARTISELRVSISGGKAEKLSLARAARAAPPTTSLTHEDANTKEATSPARHEGSEFPRFARQGKRLVKLGWSSRDARVYEHRASYEAVEEISGRFLEKAGAKGILKIEKILPMKLESGEELPSYQIYLVLKWLQHHGVIQKQGKDGYSVIDREFNLKQLWESTPTK